MTWYSFIAVVDLRFSEDNYRADEPDENMNIIVVKSGQIATDLTLTVSPVTSSKARALNLFPQGVDLPNDNFGRSPIDAGKMRMT